MNAQTLSDLKDKPLFTLTIEQFLELQQSVPVKDSSTKADDMPPKIIGIEEAVKLTGYKWATLTVKHPREQYLTSKEMEKSYSCVKS